MLNQIMYNIILTNNSINYCKIILQVKNAWKVKFSQNNAQNKIKRTFSDFTLFITCKSITVLFILCYLESGTRITIIRHVVTTAQSRLSIMCGWNTTGGR